MQVVQKLELAGKLDSFANAHPEVERCAIISTTGIMLAGYQIDQVAEDKFAAICTANFGLISRSSRELGGKMQHFSVQIEGRESTTILGSDGRQIIFIALCRKEARGRESLISEINQLISECSY